MKPAILSPLASHDQEEQIRYYRDKAGHDVAARVEDATDSALNQIERQPGIGSPSYGRDLGYLDLRTWRVARFPLLWFYFERSEHLDVVRLLGERQDIPALMQASIESRKATP